VNFFDKPLDRITIADVEWLRTSEVQEGREIEFKSGMSTDASETDAWQTGGNKIGRTAIAALVKELVAFANEQGGSLVLGLDETDDQPPRAGKITPVPRALELAERLKQTCRDNFDPPVFGLEAKGIVTNVDGAGLVVLRVPSSPYGPHRSQRDYQCYRRVNDKSVPMTMDQIHRQVIELSRRAQQAEQWFEAQKPQAISSGALGFIMRAIARPSAPLVLAKLHRETKARPRMSYIPVQDRNGMDYEQSFVLGAGSLEWRPIVRGTTASGANGDRAQFRYNGWEDGCMWMDYRWINHTGVPEQQIYMNWFMGLFGNMLLAIERTRLAANLPVPYELEFHLVSSAGYSLGDYKDAFSRGGQFSPGLKTLGRYPIGPPDTFNQLTQLFETDIYHLSGVDNPDKTMFNYSELVSQLRSEFGIT
jgi:hypothetical protein